MKRRGSVAYCMTYSCNLLSKQNIHMYLLVYGNELCGNGLAVYVYQWRVCRAIYILATCVTTS